MATATLTPNRPGPGVRAQRQAEVVRALAAVLPAHALLYTPEDTTPYECDGLTAYRERPLCVALPENYDQVQAVLRTCHLLTCRWWRAALARGYRAGPCRTPWA